MFANPLSLIGAKPVSHSLRSWKGLPISWSPIEIGWIARLPLTSVCYSVILLFCYFDRSKWQILLFWWIKIYYFDGSKFHNKIVLDNHKIMLDSHKIVLDNKIVLDSGWVPINDHGCVNNPHSSAYLSSNARWWEWILRLWRFAKDLLPSKSYIVKKWFFDYPPKVAQ